MFFFFSEGELEKALRDTLTRAPWYGLFHNGKLANQVPRLAAIVVLETSHSRNVCIIESVLEQKFQWLLVAILNLTNRMWFNVVCTLIDNDTRHCSGPNVVDS